MKVNVALTVTAAQNSQLQSLTSSAVMMDSKNDHFINIILNNLK